MNLFTIFAKSFFPCKINILTCTAAFLSIDFYYIKYSGPSMYTLSLANIHILLEGGRTEQKTKDNMFFQCFLGAVFRSVLKKRTFFSSILT